eukprot:658187-Rhodomonas_salina.1
MNGCDAQLHPPPRRNRCWKWTAVQRSGSTTPWTRFDLVCAWRYKFECVHAAIIVSERPGNEMHERGGACAGYAEASSAASQGVGGLRALGSNPPCCSTAIARRLMGMGTGMGMRRRASAKLLQLADNQCCAGTFLAQTCGAAAVLLLCLRVGQAARKSRPGFPIT